MHVRSQQANNWAYAMSPKNVTVRVTVLFAGWLRADIRANEGIKIGYTKINTIS